MWVAAFAATWFTWAWLAFGAWPLAILAALLLGNDLWRRRGVEPRPGLGRPMGGGTTAGWIVGCGFMALQVGYGSDWVVLGVLAPALALQLRDEYRAGSPNS